MSVETVMQGLDTAAAAPPVVQEPAKEVPQPVEGQPPVEEQIGKPTSEVVEPEPETEPDLELPSESSGDYEKFKAVFDSHPELKSDLKAIIGREKAFTEMAPGGSFSEMREIMQRIPSVADAEQLVADSETRHELARTFREDSPTFVESLKNSDPLAFQNLFHQLPEILAETDPQLFSVQAKAYTDRVLSNVWAMAQKDGNQELLAAVQIISQSIGAQLGQRAAAPKGNSETERLRKELDQRKAADSETAFNNFWEQTDQVVINDTVSALASTIKKSVPDASEAQVKRMVKEAYDKTLELMNQQPQTLSAINQYRENARKGRQGIAEHKAIIQFVTGRTKMVVPKAAKLVIDEWSGQVLKLNQDKTDKQKAIAAKSKDVGTGPQGTTSTAAPTTPNNGKGRHLNQILAELGQGTYVKR
jgi:hypothetical protein